MTFWSEGRRGWVRLKRKGKWGEGEICVAWQRFKAEKDFLLVPILHFHCEAPLPPDYISLHFSTFSVILLLGEIPVHGNPWLHFMSHTFPNQLNLILWLPINLFTPNSKSCSCKNGFKVRNISQNTLWPILQRQLNKFMSTAFPPVLRNHLFFCQNSCSRVPPLFFRPYQVYLPLQVSLWCRHVI